MQHIFNSPQNSKIKLKTARPTNTFQSGEFEIIIVATLETILQHCLINNFKFTKKRKLPKERINK